MKLLNLKRQKELKSEPDQDQQVSNDMLISHGTPAKIAKIEMENLESMENLTILDGNLEEKDSQLTTPVSEKRKHLKKCKFMKSTSAVRATTSPSQELMPPPRTLFLVKPDLTNPILDNQKVTEPNLDIPMLENPEPNFGNLSVGQVLGNIVEQGLLNDLDLSDLLVVDSFMSSTCLGSYMGYLITKAKVPCVAVHPNATGYYFLNNRWTTLCARDFLINPVRVPLESVKFVLIPILSKSGNDLVTIQQLERSVGHYVLAIYDVDNKKVIFFDPKGTKISESYNSKMLLETVMDTLPSPLHTREYSIISRNRAHFNLQPSTDGENCGYFVCLFAEMTIWKNFGSQIKIPNFNIYIYRQQVKERLGQILNGMYPNDFLVEKFFDQQQDQDLVTVEIKEKEDIVEIGKITETTDPEWSGVCGLAELRPVTKFLKTGNSCRQKNHPDDFCGSLSTNHKMGYFHSGGFDFKCKFCGAKLLKSEAAGRASKCCHNGS
uniref:Ubiquitin-like protease family profile domain-containing protein n=1 Tax=Romanomermis culicivorax TaxID=13658 RepID=A0A915KDE4_ROMCU